MVHTNTSEQIKMNVVRIGNITCTFHNYIKFIFPTEYQLYANGIHLWSEMTNEGTTKKNRIIFVNATEVIFFFFL